MPRAALEVLPEVHLCGNLVCHRGERVKAGRILQVDVWRKNEINYAQVCLPL